MGERRLRRLVERERERERRWWRKCWKRRKRKEVKKKKIRRKKLDGAPFFLPPSPFVLATISDAEAFSLPVVELKMRFLIARGRERR